MFVKWCEPLQKRVPQSSFTVVFIYQHRVFQSVTAGFYLEILVIGQLRLRLGSEEYSTIRRRDTFYGYVRSHRQVKISAEWVGGWGG